jgi:hypothetical protein
MGTALSTLISDLEEENGEKVISGTTTAAGATGYLIDTARTEADDYWLGCYVYIKASTESTIVGEERDITANESATGIISVAPNFPAAVPISTTYEIRRKNSRTDYKAAVNFAVLSAQGWRNELAIDDSNIIQEDKLEYTFPSGLLWLAEIWVEQRSILYKRTATGGAAGYLEDTGASFGADVDDETVVIYKGTGVGQSKTISSHTATKLNVSVNFATPPDSTSKYVVKKTSVEELAPLPLVGYRPDMAAEIIKLGAEPADLGQKMIIIYEKAPVKLTSDAQETDIPSRYITLKAMVKIRHKEAGEEGESGASAKFDVQFYEAQAEFFKGQNPPYRLPRKLTEYPVESGVGPNWPYGNPLW